MRKEEDQKHYRINSSFSGVFDQISKMRDQKIKANINPKSSNTIKASLDNPKIS